MGSKKPKQIKTDLPGSRFQEQVETQESGEMVTPTSEVGASGKDPKLVVEQMTKLANRTSIKPSSDTKLLEDTQVGGVPIGSGQAVTYNAAGAMGKSPVVDNSKIPYSGGGYRPDPRSGKGTSDNDFLINNAISEQPDPVFEGTEDLRHNQTEQGYNGTKQFKTARGKKNSGTTPQATLYDRSIDFMYVDQTIHTTGQVLDNIDAKAGYPTLLARSNSEPNVIINDDGKMTDESGYDFIQDPMEKSNYLLKSLKITVTNKRISNIEFNEDKLPAKAYSENENINQYNTNWQVDRNNVAKTVVRLQKDLGRETSEKWSPLGYVIQQPYEYNMLAHDIEATTGAIQSIAYRANVSALAYQSRNKLSKDGAKPQTPIIEMFLSGIGQLDKSIKSYTGKFEDVVFNTELMRKGSAAAIIKMFDSTGKYNTKANFFNLPRSLKYFIQTMANNMEPLHCKEEFLRALDTAHIYSTPDGNYNPMLPIVATDKISIVNPLSLNDFLRGWSRDNVTSVNPSGTAARYKYKYVDIRNNYVWALKHPVVEGICSWLLKNEGAFVKTYGGNDASFTVEIPCFFSMLAPSMWQCLLAAASQEILWARSVYFRDYLFAGDQTEYIWPDLKSIKEMDPLYSSNLEINGFKEPLVAKKMKPASFFRTFWGDNLQRLGVSGTAGANNNTIFMPWYMNENSVDNNYTLSKGFQSLGKQPHAMSYPEVRIGVCHDYIDRIKSVSERDLRLSLDRMCDIPIQMDGTTFGLGKKYTLNKTASNVNANVKVRAIRYDLNSDGRVVVGYNAGYVPNKAAVMCAAKELGYLYPSFRVAPILTKVSIVDGVYSYTTKGTYKLQDLVDGSMGYSLVVYKVTGDDSNNGSISRTAALQQDFSTIFADSTLGNDYYYSEDGAVDVNNNYFLPAISNLFNVAANAEGITMSKQAINEPFFAVGGSTKVADLPGSPKLISLAKYMWTMINRFFMPINVFENFNIVSKTDDVSAGVLIDPFESAYYFGLAGFFASDFNQDVLNRADKIDMLQLDYTEDDFIKASLIFRAD